MADQPIATVFGGSGFIGRQIVRRLAAQGYHVRIAVRAPDAADKLRLLGDVGQIILLRASVTNPAAIARAVAGASVVVNLVGILAEHRPGDFMRLQAEGAGAIARASAAAGVRRLIHISAIGANAASPSRYAQSNAAGEAAVLAAFPTATILRPSIVFGPDDGFFNRFASMAMSAPALPLIEGNSKFQPVYVGDVAAAVVRAASIDGAAGRIYELGGPDILTMRALLSWIIAQTGRRRWLLPVPSWLARLQASVLERLPGKLLTRDQLLLLGVDNVVTPGQPGLAELGITPTPIALVVPAYLARYRPGGR